MLFNPSVDITSSGVTQKYIIDNAVYIDDTEDSSPICMLIDLYNRSIMVFSNSKTADRNYKMMGYVWTSSLDTISFSKEIVFEQKNWGWLPFFNLESDETIALHHFSFESYYGVMSVKKNGKWTSTNIGSISPSYASQLRDEHDRILLLGSKTTSITSNYLNKDDSLHYFNLLGIPLEQKTNGVSIIQMNNGAVKKILIK